MYLQNQAELTKLSFAMKDEIGPTLLVLRQDIQQNIQVTNFSLDSIN
jgi:hypothetical protein